MAKKLRRGYWLDRLLLGAYTKLHLKRRALACPEYREVQAAGSVVGQSDPDWVARPESSKGVVKNHETSTPLSGRATRPLEWIEEEEAAVGEVIWPELPEMHAAGEAEVLSVSACPELEPGWGPVITGTFRHEADELVELRVAGEADSLRCTAEHPFWSATRHEFVAASELRPGEAIETATGHPARLTSITPRAGPETVYGLEVYAEHVYHVGQLGLLVHNASTSHLPVPENGHIYEIKGTVNGKKQSYVGSAFDVDARLSAKSHPARALLDSPGVQIKTREVSLSAAGSRREAFQLLRTQEQISLTSMLQSTRGTLGGTLNGWTNLNSIRAREATKFVRDFERWGDIRGKANRFRFDD